jgi:membrane-bound serine protease (ClpP class)
MITGRLILAILSTLLEEAALVVIVLWGLPQLGIEIPLAGLIAIMVVWGVFSVFIYRMGSRALRKEPVAGLGMMIGSKGKVVNPLDPVGRVKIRGEFWEAKSAAGRIRTGEEITVVGQDGLKLVVSRSEADDLGVTE